jgi:hypothetical protein
MSRGIAFTVRPSTEGLHEVKNLNTGDVDLVNDEELERFWAEDPDVDDEEE